MNTGEIYQYAYPGVDDGLAHPHVILIALGKTEWLVVPGYSSGKEKITRYVDSLKSLGFFAGEGYVEIDNATQVSFVGGFTGHLCTWATAKAFPITEKKLLPCRQMGTMDKAGVLSLIESILKIAEIKPERYSKSLVKKLAALRRELSPLTPPAHSAPPQNPPAAQS